MLDQLKKNQLALISLLVALTALGYNTWRNEQTEANRNVRQAGFEMIVHIGRLQRITFLAHYDKDPDEGNPRKGWTEVLTLQDLAQLMPGDVRDSSSRVMAAWEANWSGLGRNDDSVTAIDSAIDELRSDILAAIARLD